MSRPWIRSWTNRLDNPKVMGLSADLYKAWDCLILVAGRHDRDGELPSIAQCAFMLHISADKCQQLIDSLMGHGLIDRIEVDRPDGNGVSKRNETFPNVSPRFRVHDWQDWQISQRPSDAPDRVRERVRKHRESLRDKEQGEVRPSVTGRNGEKRLETFGNGVSVADHGSYEGGRGEISISQDHLNLDTIKGRVSGKPSTTPTQTASKTGRMKHERGEDFERFWTKYREEAKAFGRWVGSKEAAAKAWQKALVKHHGLDIQAVLAGVEAYFAMQRGQSEAFIQYAATWLNASGWEDEYDIPVAPLPNGNGKNGAIGKKLLTPTPEWANGKPVVFAYDGVHVRYMGDPEPMRRNIEDGKIYNP